MPIIEERLFGQSGLTWQLLARTKTPTITNLCCYQMALGTRIAKIEHRQYDGKPGVCFTLYDGRLLIVILEEEEASEEADTRAEARADTHASVENVAELASH